MDDPCFHDAIVKLKEYVEKYANEEHLEIEIRLGYLENDNVFKTDIGKDFYDKIWTQLADSDVWDKIEHEKSEDYFWNGRRLSVSDAKTKCIKKVKLAIFDFEFEGSGFDVRVSFSKEIPSKRYAPEKANYKRKKERTSYLWKHLSFDLTKVTMEENTIENHLYEIELEAKHLDLSKMSSHYFIHDSLLKIKDMIEMCEPLEGTPRLNFVKEKIF